jgi:hypothetical protein
MTSSFFENQVDSLKIAVSSKNNASDISNDIMQQLDNNDFAFILMFFSSQYASIPFLDEMKKHYTDTPIYGCSTAGEITPNGVSEGVIVAIGFCAHEFGVNATFIPNLDEFSIGQGQPMVSQAVQEFQDMRHSDKPHSIALMLVDGLSYREEQLVSAINSGLKDIPLIGGSAADGLNFKETCIINDGRIEKNAATLLLIESRPSLHIFKSDSFIPTPIKFVVTKADPENRIVHELNAMPAATAYAQALGIEESELDLLCFASHPLCVCFGGQCYTRSIKEVNEDGSFSFYCAIDEGIVFTLSDIDDMVKGINSTFDSIKSQFGQPQLILGFDCVLRRMMSEINQSKEQISQIYRENRVIGFNTYGEQIHAMHLNQTFSGIAIGK